MRPAGTPSPDLTSASAGFLAISSTKPGDHRTLGPETLRGCRSWIREAGQAPSSASAVGVLCLSPLLVQDCGLRRDSRSHSKAPADLHGACPGLCLPQAEFTQRLGAQVIHAPDAEEQNRCFSATCLLLCLLLAATLKCYPSATPPCLGDS